MLWPALENSLQQFRFTPEEQIILCVALIFFTGGMVIILVLFGSRVRKSYDHNRSVRLREQFRKILNAIVVNETFSQKTTPISAFDYRMAELRELIGSSPFARQRLISQILEIKKNLSGSSSQALVATYYALALERHSIRKLSSLEWKKKALGIRELAEMGHEKSRDAIARFLNARNPVLREESFMALVRLEQEKPLSFLDDYRNELTEWMCINIFSYLQKLEPRKLPDFSQWYDHPVVTVVLFSIRMTRQFRQVASLPALATLLQHENVTVVERTIEAIGEMEAFDYHKNVLALADAAWNDESVAVAFLRCMSRIADTDRDADVLQRFLQHPAYEVRFEAARTLKNLGIVGEGMLVIYNDQHAGSLQRMLSHLAEPLLQ